MIKKIPFSIICKNINTDFHFSLNQNTKNPNDVALITSTLINTIDKILKRRPEISEGDLIQSLAFFIATRISISSFNNEKLSTFFNDAMKQAVSDIESGKQTKIGNS